MVSGFGVVAATAAPIAQSFGFIIWGEHWKGSAYCLNLFKCSVAGCLFLIVSFSIRNLLIDKTSLGMLMLSSFLGIIIGDSAWIGALQIIGARQVITFDILKPFLAAIFGHFILGEELSSMIGIGLIISAAGIGIVAYETTDKQTKKRSSSSASNSMRNDVENSTRDDFSDENSFADSDEEVDSETKEKPLTKTLITKVKRFDRKYRTITIGYILAASNVIFDAYGFVITKQYGTSLNTWEINLIRFGFAGAVMIVLSILMEIISQILSHQRNIPKLNFPNLVVTGVEFTKLSDQSSHHSNDIVNPMSSDSMNDVSLDKSTAAISTPSSASISSSTSIATLSTTRDSVDTTIYNQGMMDLSPKKSKWYQLPRIEMKKDDWIKISVGVLFVTFISTTLTNYAVFQLDLGLCMTLTSLGPIVSIPLVYIMRKETTNSRAFFGAVLTILGILILSFASTSTKNFNYPWKPYRIYSLPGWYESSMPSKQYSGYVNTTMNDMTMHSHFWFVESENNPKTDPLILWFNGGPGSSSVYGNLVEIGPFRLSDLSFINTSYEKTGIPQLIYNPFGWQKVANLLFISMPPPVGYSYCSPAGPSQVGDACGSWNDTSTAQITYSAIKEWLQLFTKYRNHKIFITGESYAGIYIPMIIQQILENNNNFPIHLQGFAIGDACTPPAICGQISHSFPWNLQFLYGKSAISIKLHEKIQNQCTEDELYNRNLTSTCQSIVNQVRYESGGYYEYSYYDDCWYQNGFSSTSMQRNSNSNRNRMNDYRNHDQSSLDFVSTLPTYTYHTGLDGYACGSDQAMFEWLSHPTVKQALHVPTSAKFYQVDNAVGFPYDTTETDLISWYKSIVESNTLRILIYNGDTDPAINSYRSQDWVSSLRFDEIESWRPWTLDGCQRMGGAVTRYINSFDHLTIRGSGHMVPLFKPEASLEFITKFITEQDYLSYDSTCSGSGEKTSNSDIIPDIGESDHHRRHHHTIESQRVDMEINLMKQQLEWSKRESKLRAALQNIRTKI